MAHILVYLQRTPGGLHPASAVALCRARDIASDRGATLTALCPGDAGTLDRGIAQAASRFGADILVFGGPRGLQGLLEQLNPVHVLVPWSREGLAAAEELPSGPAVPRWLSTPRHTWGGADAVTAVVAGTLPWHAFSESLEAEYQADVDEVSLPAWTSEAAPPVSEAAPVFTVLGEGSIRWLAPQSPDRSTVAALERLGATPATLDASPAEAGTLLWLSAEPIPAAVAERPVTTRLLVLPGPDAGLDPSWTGAEWVLSGSRTAALDAIFASPWAPLRG
ncbi:MAG: hypothetical protein KDK70_02590 [Myxococcales bacterium]|nr:hypothetical protein [Myxococcales bacterium]